MPQQAAEPAVQPGLPFGEADDAPPPKGPAGPWEEFLEDAGPKARQWEMLWRTSHVRLRKGRRR